MRARVARHRIMLAIALLLAAALHISRPQALAAERIKLALPSKSMGYLPLFVALHRGFFTDEGIELEFSLMLPNIAHNALFSGEIDYHGVADSALRLGAKGAPIKTIFFGARLPNYFLMAKPEFRSVPELRGKKIGVSRFGSTTDLAARVALSSYGLDPQRDVILIMIGLPSTRVAALTSGSIDATIANPPDNGLLKQKGFNELLFLGDAIEFPSNGFTTTDRRLKEQRDQVKRFLRALYKGLTFARERADETISIMGREWKVEPRLAQDSYSSIIRSISKDGTASEAGLKVHLKLIQNTEKGIGEISWSKMVDFRLLEEVRRELGGR